MQAVPRKGVYVPFSAALYAQQTAAALSKSITFDSLRPTGFPVGLWRVPAAQNWISLPFLRHCLNSATAVNSASDEELMAVSSES